MMGIHKFFEQSEMDEGKCNMIFKAISAWDNAFDSEQFISKEDH